MQFLAGLSKVDKCGIFCESRHALANQAKFFAKASAKNLYEYFLIYILSQLFLSMLRIFIILLSIG